MRLQSVFAPAGRHPGGAGSKGEPQHVVQSCCLGAHGDLGCVRPAVSVTDHGEAFPGALPKEFF